MYRNKAEAIQSVYIFSQCSPLILTIQRIRLGNKSYVQKQINNECVSADK